MKTNSYDSGVGLSPETPRDSQVRLLRSVNYVWKTSILYRRRYSFAKAGLFI